MPLVAGDVKLADPLRKPLGAIGAKAQTGLADALGRLRTRAQTSKVVSGRPQGGYEDQALEQAGTMAGRGIDDSLYNVLGSGSLQDVKSQQEYQRKMALAKEIGDMMSPSTAEEILGGLSQGVNLGAKGKGIYDALGQGNDYSGPRPSSSSSLNLYKPGGYAPQMPSYEEPYDYRQWWG